MGYLVFVLVQVFHGDAFSDTELYRRWSIEGFSDQHNPPPWVYPLLGLLPIWIAGYWGPTPFFLLWFLMVALLNGVALGFLVRRSGPTSRVLAGWWWLIFLAIMGLLGFARVDGITAPIVLIALDIALMAPLIASMLLATATWMKIWPAAPLLALFLVVRRRWSVALGAFVITVAVAWGSVFLGISSHLFSFLSTQGSRGMQLEATFSTPWLWMSVLHIADARMFMNTEINSVQVDGPGSAWASAGMQPLFLVATLIIALFVLAASRRNQRHKRGGYRASQELFLLASLATVSAFIVFNKVGSPQFMLWLGPVVACGLAHNTQRWRLPAGLLLAIACMTFLLYPLFYDALSNNDPLMAGVLTLRNALLVVLLIWSVRQVIRRDTGFGEHHSQPFADGDAVRSTEANPELSKS